MLLEKVFGNEMPCCRSGAIGNDMLRWEKVFDNEILCCG